MPTDLAMHIQNTPLCDSHEHLRSEHEYTTRGPDILQSLFENYVRADLINAGAEPAAIARLTDNSDPDVRARFAGIEAAWRSVRHTGYGEAVQLAARMLYGIDTLTASAIEAAQPRHEQLRQPGQRLAMLRDGAHLDHVQVDDFTWACQPDASGPGFFFYDISWWSFSNGTPDLQALAETTGIEVNSLDTLRAAMRALFDLYAEAAIAVKSQHAYDRTLHWQPRSDAEAAKALEAYRRDPQAVSEADRLCLGDWLLARGVELSIEYQLPFKIHTGSFAGTGPLPLGRLRAGHLWELLALYPQARFVLMHIAYPYHDELVAMVKHYPNTFVDLSWAWSLDPYSTGDFLRRCLHAAPSNKLFIFGGDTYWPSTAVAYALQARRWFTRTLQAEVDEGLLSEREAIDLAAQLMRDNQYAFFRVAEKREAVLKKYAQSLGPKPAE